MYIKKMNFGLQNGSVNNLKKLSMTVHLVRENSIFHMSTDV